MVKAADNQVCPKGKENCQAAVRHTNVVKVKSLGIEGELSSGRYGAKLQKLVDLIHSIPKDQRVLVFLQWEDLVPKVSEALDSGKIPHVKLYGSTKTRANVLDKFQQSDSDTARVLLLKINDASAAGSNLTTANHAIFLGPLFTNSLLNYRAVETQAIGRVRRYGQDRTVHIHRLLAMDTIDVTIYEARQKELEAKPDYEKIPRKEYEGKKRKSQVQVEIVSPAKKKATRDEPMEID
jgi:SNF2 family DNA or RNA helicase